MGKKNFYRTAVGSIEKERLEEFEEPTRVSLEILDGLEFTSLIDAGAGPNTELALYVTKQRAAQYTGFDIREDFTTALRDNLGAERISARVLSADIRLIPSRVGRADIVHERFVLTHLSVDDRSKALNELLNIANDKVILMEYNWRPMRSTAHSPMLRRFIEASAEAMEPFNINPFLGESLPGLINGMAYVRSISSPPRSMSLSSRFNGSRQSVASSFRPGFTKARVF
jgi:hypothetical protein